LIIVICGYLFGWKWTGLPKQTLWDWLSLLIVPSVLAVGGYLFTRSENRATQAAAERRAQDDALQAYLDHMSELLIPKKDQPSLYRARPGDSLSEVARARTLTALPRLDGNRKARVVQFLYEAGLITTGRPVLDLSGADLSYAELSYAELSYANLRHANLSYATLINTDLSYVWGWSVDQLSATTTLECTMPDGQILRGAKMPNGPTFEDWLKDNEDAIKDYEKSLKDYEEGKEVHETFEGYDPE
jgi:hypothetical protein